MWFHDWHPKQQGAPSATNYNAVTQRLYWSCSNRLLKWEFIINGDLLDDGIIILAMANGVNTEWFDLQVKFGNYLPKEKEKTLYEMQSETK